MPSTTLKIAGSTVNRPASKLVPVRLTLSMDRPDEFEFTELAANLPGSYHPEQAVQLLDGTTPLFSGWIFSRHPDGFGEGPTRIGYRCLGLSYVAALVAIQAADGTGTMQFNLPVDDDDYVQTEAGLSVGTIISQAVAQHSSQLATIGVSTDATTTSHLAALTVVPPDPVYLSGNSLWTQLLQLVQQWYGSRYALRIEPSGLVRCWDTYSLTAKTVTLDTDPAIFGVSEDTAECYTRVVLRGRANIEPAYLSLHDGTLVAAWSAPDQAAWKIDDFLHPKNAYSIGAITALTSTVATVQSDNALESWVVNYWNGIQGQIDLINPVITGPTDVTGFNHRNVTACSALTAGGTATITLDRPLDNAGYTRYQLRGTPPGKSLVWRKYSIPNRYVAQHLAERFNHSVKFSTNASVVSQVVAPAGVIDSSSGGLSFQEPANFEVVPFDGTNDGYILFYFPVVQFTGTSEADLEAGGGHVTAPTDIEIVVPYGRGTLSLASPPDVSGVPQYSGTASTRFGITRTLYRDYPAWIDGGNSSNMQTLADNILSTVDNVVIEGGVTYLDYYANALPSGSWPISLNVAKATGTTGYESMAAPVRTVTLEWPQEGGATWVTRLGFSTRRQMYSGDRLYVHPMYVGGNFLSGAEGLVGGGAPRFAGMTGFAGADAYQGQAPDMQYGDDSPGRRKGRTRLGREGDRYQAAEAHDAQDRRRRELAEARAAEAEDQKHEGAENIAHLDRTRTARRRAILEPGSEEGQRLAGAESIERDDTRQSTERVAAADSRRRARRMEGPQDREYRIAGERPTADPAADTRRAKADEYLNDTSREGG